MKRQVRIFVGGRELDLFNDENIEVNSTIQNIQDISKTFTDFSQSFTVPTSPNNNAIFQHFYQNDTDATINYQERIAAYIEVDMATFRTGKVQMEKSQLKNGQSDNYTVTFYGELTSLKDLFGEDLLSDLDYTTLNHDYNFTEVYNRITTNTTDFDVCYPLISSNRLWEYATINPFGNLPFWLQPPASGNDIHQVSGAIQYKELFPALRVKSIITAISQRYGMTFTGPFLSDPKFTQAYIWYKNKDVIQTISESQDLTFQSIVSHTNILTDLTPYVDIANSSISIQYIPDVYVHDIEFTPLTASTGAHYYVDVFRNNTFYCTLDGLSFTMLNNYMYSQNALGLNDVYKFKVRADNTINVKFRIKYSVLQIGNVVDEVKVNTNTITINNKINLALCAPVMKVADFFSGILKEFNMTCYATSLNTFQMMPLQNWYGSGAVIDITKYTDKNEIGIERVKLYNKIAFKYQQSNSFMNKFYYDTWNKEYGNTEYQYPYDGGEFTVEVPFENLMFNKFTGSNLQVGFALDSSYSPYIPKPCIMYKYGLVNVTDHIYYGNGGSHVSNHNYMMFGQDLKVNGINYSLNFSPDTSTFSLQAINDSMFATYYFSYLANLYALKNRLTTVKTVLPISLLTGLKLNDRLIIRDKRYIINEMKSNLVSGETTFTLLNDFLPVNPQVFIRPPRVENVIVTPIVFPTGVIRPSRVIVVRFRSATADVIIDPPELTQEDMITITLPAVLGNEERIIENTDDRITEDGANRETEGSNEYITIFADFEFENGDELTQEIIISR
jgi:hypothetical protein